MGIDPIQFRDLVMIPALTAINLCSPAAVNLLLGTLSQESHFGVYLHQINGPALGVYQIEPATHKDIWNRAPIAPWPLLHPNPEIWDEGWAILDDSRLIYDLRYATQIARLKYWFDPKPLPDKDDKLGLGKYWKRVYNTELGKGSVAEWLDNLDRYVYWALL